MTVQLEGLEVSFETNIGSTAKEGKVLDVSSGSVKKHLATMSMRDFEGFDDFEDMLDLGDKLVRNEVGRVEVEHGEVTLVPLGWLNRLRQTRQHYDPEKIVDLAKAIEMKNQDGRKILKLLSPLQIVVCTDEQLPIYLADHKDFYGEETNPDDLVKGDDGLWYIVDAGHRRSIGLEYECLKESVDPLDMDVPCVLLMGMSFEEALGYQSRENEYDRPPVVDEAEQIARYFKFLKRRQMKMPTHRQIAGHFGVKERKVSNALKFDELPNEVQREIKKGHVNWSNGLHLHQLMRHLNAYYPEKYKAAYAEPETKRTLARDVNDELMTVIKKLRSKELDKASAKFKTSYIDAKIKVIRESMLTPELFQLDYELTPSERRQRAENALGRKAIGVVSQHVDGMVLTTDTVAELEELRDKIEQKLEKRKAIELDKDELDDEMFGISELAGSVA